jgi:hypothetical protein
MGADVVKMATHVAIDGGITLAEYLTERVRLLVKTDFEEMARKLKKPEPTRKAKKGEQK